MPVSSMDSEDRLRAIIQKVPVRIACGRVRPINAARAVAGESPCGGRAVSPSGSRPMSSGLLRTRSKTIGSRSTRVMTPSQNHD